MNAKKLYGHLLKSISTIFGIDAAKQFDASIRFHKILHLRNPQSLADKVSYIELHNQSDVAPMCTDKYAVREYVKSKGLGEILVPLAGGPWTAADEVDFHALPESFVLKGTHGCKMNYLVPDKATLDVGKCRKEMQRWLDTTYGTYSLEPHYLFIPHRIYAETFLQEANKLVDYKFHCLNGVPRFVLCCSDRQASGDAAMKVTLSLYDMGWRVIPEIRASGSEIAKDGAVAKPEELDKMIRIAEILSADFDFVRVDLYELNGKVYFGELTFSPACCVFPYFTDKFNQEMGKLLML